MGLRMRLRRLIHSMCVTDDIPKASMMMSTYTPQNSEMMHKSRPTSIFALPSRPTSTFTDILDDGSDWEDESGSIGSGSDFEDDELPGEESPRGSFDTMTTVDEAPTPRMSNKDFFAPMQRASTSGPSGPHLFRISFDGPSHASILSPFVADALQMSPIMDKGMSVHHNLVGSPLSLELPEIQIQESEPLPGPAHQSQEQIIRAWSVDQVVAWMYGAGFEPNVIDKFEENDINGRVLMDMQFEHLRELGFRSFGQRHEIWTALAALRGDEVTSPAVTDFEDREELAARLAKTDLSDDDCETPPSPNLRRRRAIKKNRTSPMNDPITPGDSVSIVAIEQLMPRPHRCPKGEACPTYQKREKLRRRIEKEMAISPTGGGGQILLAGDFEQGFDGQIKIEEGLRAAEPSYVASSDLLGAAAQTPDFRMDSSMQRTRDQHESKNNVKQYLTLQHIDVKSPEEPPTPPLETPFFRNVREDVATPRFAKHHSINIPPSPAPLSSLRDLPKLSIPRSATAEPRMRSAKSPRSARSPRTSAPAPSPRQSMRSSTGSNIYRIGTPASLNDMPLDNVKLWPISRDQSSSVPPNMHYRAPVKHRGSQDPSTWQRASLKLPLIPEHANADLITPTKSPIRPNVRILYGSNTTYAGHARKRKAKFLKHEWTEHHMRLKGTQLAVHATALPNDREALETINIDDFSVVCAGMSTDSKLSAAMKALRLSSEKKGKKDVNAADAAFVFQLIPENDRGRILKVLKEMKTHHFAVKSQDERIEWVRQVMLAKAKRQKEVNGYANVVVNGEEVV